MMGRYKQGRLEVQGYPQLHRKLKNSLGYMKPSLKEKKIKDII